MTNPSSEWFDLDAMIGRVALVGVNRWGFPSLAAAYLKNWAERDDALKDRVAIQLLEVPYADPPGAAARAILAGRPALVGFSCFLWNVGRVLEIARELKELEPGIRIALGGPEVTPTARQTMDAHPEVDFVACGEGEEVFRLLLRCLVLDDRPLSEVPGLAYRDAGSVRKTAEPPLIDMDLIPLVYSEGAAATDPTRALIESSRGCPFTCSFCDWGPRKMRYVPVRSLEKEFRALAGKTRWVHLCDADVLMDKARGLAIMEAFLRATEGSLCTLKFDTNPTFLHREIADLVARDPLKFSMTLGLQTINEDSLKRVNRHFDRRKVEENLGYLRKRSPQAQIMFSLIYGLPGDDLDGLRATLDWSLRWRPFRTCAQQLLMIPGADIAEESDRFGAKHQTQPPYQVYETATMSRRDVGRARELAFHLTVLYSLQPCADALLLDDRVDLAAWEPGARIGLVEDWIAHLKSQRIDLTFGMPVAATDGFRVEDRADMAVERLAADKLLLAALLQATRRFAEKPAGSAV